MTRTPELSHPDVASVRATFEDSPESQRHRLQFDALWDRFASGETFTFIATAYPEVSRFFIAKLYRSYFRQFLGAAREEAVKAFARVHAEADLARREDELPADCPVHAVLAYVRACGYTATVAINRSRETMTTAIRFSGNRTGAIYEARTAPKRKRGSPRAYFMVGRHALLRSNIVFLYLNTRDHPKRMFVQRSMDVFARLFSLRGDAHRLISVSVTEPNQWPDDSARFTLWDSEGNRGRRHIAATIENT